MDLFGQISSYRILFSLIWSFFRSLRRKGAHSFSSKQLLLLAVFSYSLSCPEFLHLCLVKRCCFLRPELLALSWLPVRFLLRWLILFLSIRVALYHVGVPNNIILYF